MNTERTEKFVNAIACDLEEGGFRQVSGTTLRRTLATAVSAALPLLAEQQCVRVQRWGMGPYPHSPDIGMLRDPEGRYVLFTDHERVVAELQAALAATGKQQVGEVQGDARLLADVDERINTAKGLGYEDDIGVGIGLLQCVRAALAARQPGAQMPVASVEFINGHAAELVFTGAALPDGQHALYAAPPAQGIDPSGGMAQEYQRWIDFYHAGEGSYDDFLSKHVLIDQRDAAPEVGNG